MDSVNGFDGILTKNDATVETRVRRRGGVTASVTASIRPVHANCGPRADQSVVGHWTRHVADLADQPPIHPASQPRPRVSQTNVATLLRGHGATSQRVDDDRLFSQGRVCRVANRQQLLEWSRRPQSRRKPRTRNPQLKV